MGHMISNRVGDKQASGLRGFHIASRDKYLSSSPGHGFKSRLRSNMGFHFPAGKLEMALLPLPPCAELGGIQSTPAPQMIGGTPVTWRYLAVDTSTAHQ